MLSANRNYLQIDDFRKYSQIEASKTTGLLWKITDKSSGRVFHKTVFFEDIALLQKCF